MYSEKRNCEWLLNIDRCSESFFMNRRNKMIWEFMALCIEAVKTWAPSPIVSLRTNCYQIYKEQSGIRIEW
jgi:hypothetical protein